MNVPDVDDATQYIVRYVREGHGDRDRAYGYGVHLQHVMAFYLRETGQHQPGANLWDVVNANGRTLSPPFAAAAWNLCRRGILRPGVVSWGMQATTDGAGGFGFSVTPAGQEWIAAAPGADYLPVEPGRFARMLATRGASFGGGFVERAQEAVRAYDAQAYLACCAMCGAATESILLRLATDKAGDESRVLKDYESAGGRGRLEKSLTGQLPGPVQAEFRRYTDLLKYWRDSAAHGRAVHMTEAEAFGALILLLRFAIFAEEHRREIVRAAKSPDAGDTTQVEPDH